MSLYYVQKYLYELNRNPSFQQAHRNDPELGVRSFGDGGRLSSEEIDALVKPDIGKLYHLGVNGQILMHFAAFHQIEWADYLEQMREGIRTYGPVREGVYALTTKLTADNAPVHRSHQERKDPKNATGLRRGV